MSFAVPTHRIFAQARSVSEETHAIQRRWVALGQPASDRRLADLDRILIVPMKSAGLLAKHRFLYMPQHGVEATKVDLINPTATLLSAVNSPSIIPDVSFGGDGVSSYFDTPVNMLSDGGVYTAESAFMAVWSITDISASVGTDIGSGTAARIVGRNGSAGTYNANASNRTFPAATSLGLYGWTRRNANDQFAFRDGAIIDTYSQPVSVGGIPNAVVKIGQRGSNTYSARQFIAAACGGALSDADILAQFTIYGAWLDHIGAI